MRKNFTNFLQKGKANALSPPNKRQKKKKKKKTTTIKLNGTIKLRAACLSTIVNNKTK